jgi:hypothetical protein
MYVTLGVIVLIAAGLAISRWMPHSVDTTALGTVSQQWLAEYRASHQE